MPQQIIRLYDAATSGAKAAQDLMEEGFKDVFHFKSAGGKGAAAAKSHDALVAEMTAAQIYNSHAQAYAEQLAKGGSMVLVHAPFGSGVNAARIVDAHGPSAKGMNEVAASPEFVWESSAPFSSALQLPVLLKMEHPFEMLTGVSSLTKGKAFISSLLDIPLLTRGKQHATSSFGIPLLSKGLQHANTSMGLPLLSRSATPLSSLLGIKVLSR